MQTDSDSDRVGDRERDPALRIGFLGFGEVAHYFAKGLRAHGCKDIVAYSRRAAKAAADDPLRMYAMEAGVELAASPRDLAQRADLILAVTPGAAAVAAARSIRAYLKPGQIYIDASTGAVEAMERIDHVIGARASFVDAAIMNAVPLGGIKVPIVMSGGAAERARELLSRYGMNIQVVHGKPGSATAMKLIRSVCMKGLAAVLLESLEAAHRHGILDEVAADLAGSVDERPFEQIIKRYVCGTAVHAERRIHEMSESLALLRALGSSTRMTRATRAKIADIAALGLREKFGGREPDTIGPVLQAIVDASA